MLTIAPPFAGQRSARPRDRRGFSYVGLSQVLAWLGFGILRLASRRGRAAQALPQPERSVSADGGLPSRLASAFGGSSKQPRRFHSAIRAQANVSLAHEIKYGEIGAPSRSRAHTAVEALAQKAARAADPDPALRGSNGLSSDLEGGGNLRLVGLAFQDSGP